jgi:hypothetical protein
MAAPHPNREQDERRREAASAGRLKGECHRLLDEAFGRDRGGRREAYAWLRRTFGRQVHFSEIGNERELRAICDRIYVEKFRRAGYAHGSAEA